MIKLPELRARLARWIGSPRLVRFITGLGLVQRPDLVADVVDEHPDPGDMDPRILYVVTTGPWPKWAVFKCPCGCGDVIDISVAQGKNSWNLQMDRLGRPSLHPSVWRHARCYSHFWLSKGRVKWCADTGKPLD